MKKIESWLAPYPPDAELDALVQALGQNDWMTFTAPWHRSSHVLIARDDDNAISGYLRFVVQQIGEEDEHLPVIWADKPLMEAKVLAFGVVETQRRLGIGQALQLHMLNEARSIGCYQARSHSSGDDTANHALKLAMGFAVQPVIKGADRGGLYFVKAL